MPELPDLERKSVEGYVNSQTRDESDLVKIVQKVGTRRVAHTSYEMYDVWTEQGSRWWVITEPLNLYSQEDFNNVDMAFTHHLGLRAQLYDRRPLSGSAEAEAERERDAPPWYLSPLRTYERAVQTMAEAVDAEDFQAVGIRCRETLLSLVRGASREDWVPEQTEPPKTADFKGWLEIFGNALAANSKQRTYLKSVGIKTWDLCVWLQHYTDATEWDAEIVLNATRNFLTSFALAHRRFVEGDPDRCPQCDSYRLRPDEDLGEQSGKLGWVSRPVCLGCGWQGHETFEPFTAEYLQRLADYTRAVQDEELEGGDEAAANTAPST
ncbi:hypothetical protein ACWEEK_29830 [Micromonospora aurantiaca (nom. illeg.)]